VRTFEITRESRYEDAGGVHGSARHAPDEVLTAGNLAALLRAAGLPCVTLTDEDGAAAGVTGTDGEGLRIVDGSMPVRVRYACEDGNDAALNRRGGHLMWLADFTEGHRWSVEWAGDDGGMTVHPEPWPAT
jgi:hypothetical protein